MPVRVLRVIPRYAPAWRYGGSVRYSYDLDVALARRGFDITVYTSDQIHERRRAPDRAENLDGIQVLRFPNPSNYVASKAAWLGLYPVGLRDALRAHVGDFDLVHISEARGAHARWAFAAARAPGIPVVWSPLGTLADGVGIRKPYRRLYDIVHHTRRRVNDARALIAQSPHEAALFEKFGARPSQIKIIGLGVDERSFRDLPARGHLRRALGIQPDEPVILFMGRLHPTKGLDVLLKSSAIVKRSHPTLHVVLIGWDHGALRTVLQVTRSLGLEGTVKILPPAFEAARIQAYVDADVFAVAATTYEETSLAAMEAAACGTPCVLTRQCEVPGLEAAGGGRVTACNPESFAAGLRAVLADREPASRGQSTRRAILARQSIEASADLHATLFRELVDDRIRSHRPVTAVAR